MLYVIPCCSLLYCLASSPDSMYPSWELDVLSSIIHTGPLTVSSITDGIMQIHPGIGMVMVAE